MNESTTDAAVASDVDDHDYWWYNDEGQSSIDYVSGIIIDSLLIVLLLWWSWKLCCSDTSIGNKPKLKNVITNTKSNPTSTKSDIDPSTSKIVIPASSPETSNSKSKVNHGFKPQNDNIEIEMYKYTNGQRSTSTDTEMCKESNPKMEIKQYAKIFSITHIVLAVIHRWGLFLVRFLSVEIACNVWPITFHLGPYSRMILYLYYMERARRIFHDTPFQIKSWRYRLIIAWYIFGYSTAGISTDIWFYGFVCPGLRDDTPTNGNLFFIFISWPLLNEIIGISFCLIFFVRKIRKLMKMTSSDSKSGKMDVGREKSKQQIKYVIKKMTVLSCSNIITTMFLVLINGSVVFRWVAALETFIVAITMILTFAFMDKLYKRVCCVCIHCCKCL